MVPTHPFCPAKIVKVRGYEWQCAVPTIFHRISWHIQFFCIVVNVSCVCVCVALHALLCLHQNRVPFYCLWFVVGWSFFLFCFSRRGLQCNDLCVGRSVATDVLSMLRTRFTTLIYLFRCKLGKIDDHFRYIPGAHTHCERDTRRERGKNQITKSKEHAQICSRAHNNALVLSSSAECGACDNGKSRWIKSQNDLHCAATAKRYIYSISLGFV